VNQFTAALAARSLTQKGYVLTHTFTPCLSFIFLIVLDLEEKKSLGQMGFNLRAEMQPERFPLRKHSRPTSPFRGFTRLIAET